MSKVALCANGNIRLCGGAGSNIMLCAPCSCPYADTAEGPENLQIDGYTNGFLTACGACEDATDETEWDGTFIRYGSCEWRAGYGGNLQINGKFAWAENQVVWLDTNNCKWGLIVVCYNTDTSEFSFIWLGEKTTGDTPIGTYTRTDGCDSTPTLDIV